jgi:hypothetical protein
MASSFERVLSAAFLEKLGELAIKPMVGFVMVDAFRWL